MSILIDEAAKAYENSYSPYSKIRIGAAVRGNSGKIYKGANIENASYGATICAERSAIVSAISAGETAILELAVTGDIDDYAYPCGMCRQVMTEFMKPDSLIHIAGRNRKEKTFKLKELIPEVFDFNKGGK